MPTDHDIPDPPNETKVKPNKSISLIFTDFLSRNSLYTPRNTRIIIWAFDTSNPPHIFKRTTIQTDI